MTSLDLAMEKFSKKENTDNKIDTADDILSVYDEKELQYLDKYLRTVKNAFDEDELYQIILNCGFIDERIERTIKDRLKYLAAKGIEYGWNVIDKKHKKIPVDFSQIVNKPEEGAKEDKKKKPKKNLKNKRKQPQIKDKQVIQKSQGNYEDKPAEYDSFSNEYKNNYATDYYQEAANYSFKYNKDNSNYNRQYSSYSNNSGYYNNYSSYYDTASYNTVYDDYYGNYYYSQGYYADNQGNTNFQKKRRPNNYNESGNNYYYGQNDYSSYSANYRGKERKSNKNFRVIITELNDDEGFIKTNLINRDNEKEIIEKTEIVKEDNLNIYTSAEENIVIEKKDNSTECKIDKNLNENKKADSNTPYNERGKLKTAEILNEIEEINVNKVDIENLRSYFDKFKHFTIFNEATQPSTTTSDSTIEKKQGKPFFDQFNNFKASSAIIRSFLNNHNTAAGSVLAKDKAEPENESMKSISLINTKETSMAPSKNQNNLSINNQILEITSNSSKFESDFDGKKISTFSLSISGCEKNKKVEDVSSGIKAPVQDNKISSNITNSQPILPIVQPVSSLPNHPTPMPNNYMYYPNYTNMMNTQPINPYMQYEQPGYQNIPNRMNYSDAGHYNQEYMPNIPNDMYGQYDYPQYQYYGMPYRFNSLQYPGLQNYQYAGGYPTGYIDNTRYPYMNPNAPDSNYNAFPNYQMNPNANINYNQYTEQQKRK